METPRRCAHLGLTSELTSQQNEIRGGSCGPSSNIIQFPSHGAWDPDSAGKWDEGLEVRFAKQAHGFPLVPTFFREDRGACEPRGSQTSPRCPHFLLGSVS